MSKYEITIGIECHVQLSTKTKLFSEVDNDARGKDPNSCISPVDFALPGMLPRLNQEAVRYSVIAGLALNSEINLVSRFDRKHYYYPDSPKGYQITQLHQPIIGAGYVSLPDGSKVRIEHAHLEEDAGKLTHFSDYSLVDLNRVGTPLIEIVSMPDIHSAKQAHDYCKELWRIMTYAGVTDGDLYHGNMRFDVNISLALPGAKELGTRAEIKNLNSFRSVERAVEYEYQRQAKILDNGEKVMQETRGWSDDTGKTTSQRSKEEAQDYRYMPEPDVPPIRLSVDFIENEKAKMNLLPEEYRLKFAKVLSSDTLEILLDYQPIMESLQNCAVKIGLFSNDQYSSTNDAKMESEKFTQQTKMINLIANLFASVLLAEEKFSEMLRNLPSSRQLVDLTEMNYRKELSSTATKEVFLQLFDPKMIGKETKNIAKELNLIQENDLGALEEIVDGVLANPATKKAQEDYKNGEEKVLGFLVGQVMKASRGKANPAAVQEILRNKLR